MKTTEQILARIDAVKQDDWMGTQLNDLLAYLPFEAARPFLKESVSEADWTDVHTRYSAKGPLEEARSYLSFAWTKANDCRGLSAGRSIDHFKAWLWLGGYEDVVEKHLSARYNYYGKPQLVMISELLGFDWRTHDDGQWRDDESSEGINAGIRDAYITGACQTAAEARAAR